MSIRDESSNKKFFYPALRLCCNRINENHRSLSNLSLNTITSSVLSLAHHGSNSSSGQGPSRRSPVRLFQYPAFTPPFPSSSCSSNNVAPSSLSSSVVSSIDKELLEIQTKLVFPPSIRVSDHYRYYHYYIVWLNPGVFIVVVSLNAYLR